MIPAEYEEVARMAVTPDVLEVLRCCEATFTEGVVLQPERRFIGMRVVCGECYKEIDVAVGEPQHCECTGVVWRCDGDNESVSLTREPGGLITGPWHLK